MQDWIAKPLQVQACGYDGANRGEICAFVGDGVTVLEDGWEAGGALFFEAPGQDLVAVPGDVIVRYPDGDIAVHNPLAFLQRFELPPGVYPSTPVIRNDDPNVWTADQDSGPAPAADAAEGGDA